MSKSKNHKKVCRVLTYMNHRITATSTITGCVFISPFASLIVIPIGIASSAIGYRKKNTESKNPKVVRTKNGRIMLLSKCAVCNSRKLRFLKGQEARGVLSNFLGVKVPILSDIPVLITLF